MHWVFRSLVSSVTSKSQLLFLNDTHKRYKHVVSPNPKNANTVIYSKGNYQWLSSFGINISQRRYTISIILVLKTKILTTCGDIVELHYLGEESNQRIAENREWHWRKLKYLDRIVTVAQSITKNHPRTS